VVRNFSRVRLIAQLNAGPAAARNRGAFEAQGDTLLFTDDDCVPQRDWVSAMLAPFADPEVVGAKGAYRTRQTSLAARFVQMDYEDRYRLMAGVRDIDFIDTYSAAFARQRFLEMNGYDTSFPVACAEDIELSYRMSARGWKMRFVPSAVVYHSHPDSLWRYLKKKYKFAYWRVLAVKKNPGKAIKDSHTPQIMKLQLLFLPALVLALILDLTFHFRIPLTVILLGCFLISTLPFAFRAFRKDPLVALLSPFVLGARACAQTLGVIGGAFYARREPSVQETSLHT
jgi:cellulose synthase/poly-beta-1,6-N-acetylglucosamine synthase-like glycosyltransferase